jgi:hypothetical protein
MFKLRLLLALVFIGAFSLSVVGQTPLYTFRGEANSSYVGDAVATPGDLDGDGIGDILYGESGYGVAGKPNCGRVTAISGATGLVIYRVVGPTAGEFFGENLAGLGDIDLDGVNDWIGGSHHANATAGNVNVVSGLTGTIIRTHSGAPAPWGASCGDSLGYVVSGARDIDGDLVPDYLVGAKGEHFCGLPCYQRVVPGYVDVLSGATGTVIHSISGALCSGVGVACCGLPDLNGDGLAEFLIGAPWQTYGGAYIEVRDGLTGNVLRTHPGPLPLAGKWVAELGDIDGLGTPDYGCSCENYQGSSGGAGFFYVYSGETGALIRTYMGNQNGDIFGWGAGNAGDYNGDGFDDLFIAAPYHSNQFSNDGRVAIVDGATGATLYQVFGTAANDLLGWADRSAVIQDLDGDGKIEIVAGTPLNDLYGQNRGFATVYSSQQKPHWLLQSLISIANPGLVEFKVDGGAGDANVPYAVLGSLTGLAPPHVIGPVSLPLVQDFWFDLTLNPATTPITSGFGYTDAQGKATASFLLPPGLPPALNGLQHWSAAVIININNGTITVTNPAVFSLVYP